MRATALLLIAICSLASARQPVRFKKAMVVAQEPHAADVGVDILRAGGNAVDAAVAVGFALAVTYPVAGNLGGGGFALIRMADGRTAFLDFRERAPLSATRNMYLDAAGNPTRDSVSGWRAAGVPGSVRGLEAMHRKFGSRPWAKLLAPSVTLAKKGFLLSDHATRSLRGNAKDLEPFPESKRIFLNNGRFFEMGDRLRQPELAATLARIAKRGARDFYEGETARILAEQCAANGGLITQEDLRQYQVHERPVLKGTYKGYEVLAISPPSSGGVGILQMMGVLDGSGYEKTGAGSARAIHMVAETMRRYYADRAEHLGDPDFHKVPLRGLFAADYVGRLRAAIDPDHATPSAQVKAGTPAPGAEPTETTHFSIVDAQGNAVALTYTINGGFGNGVTVPKLGFLLNNEMDDFAVKPGVPNMFQLIQGEGNAIQPKKTPRSSMTPTMLVKDGKLRLIVGAPGGSRIITGVLQVILNVVDHGMNIQEAIDAPRFHHQWMPDKLMLEKGFSPDTVELLKARGHAIDSISGVANVNGIVLDGTWLAGAWDGRGDGKVAGY
ncbi:MAG: gamma-glutamyltransferase [Bryobacterales bacterium]|nr:gamma-glutamyltransferase [Bryobacterales bacterium]